MRLGIVGPADSPGRCEQSIAGCHCWWKVKMNDWVGGGRVAWMVAWVVVGWLGWCGWVAWMVGGWQGGGRMAWMVGGWW